ncbi:MAG: DUF362 domain-containing protein [Smithella sp.]|nr:DUF362 domain-containing protein [Smithella sp.]MDM7988524.1 DUF362 domain-containing protein [Smithella sp.]HQI71533.1 DUF362 domain-containing protein [Smithella sp.]
MDMEDSKEKSKVEVVVSDTKPGVADAICKIFDHFGGGGKFLRSSRDVYIKVNAVGLEPYVYTDPEVLRQTIIYFKKCGARKIYVIENCTQANFTRLVFKAIGYLNVCRETGAIPVYLDETPPIPIFLEGIEEFIDISHFVFERLIEQGAENFYLSLPKLKTHSMSQVTLSIKNQFGLVHQNSRIADHNYRLHQKFADIYRVLRPDFALIDGLIATTHGHYPSTFNASRCVVPMDVLIGGPDPLAVDVVGAAMMGFTLKDVKHLELSAATGIGQSDIEKIDIVHKELFDTRRKKLTCELLDDYPPDITFLRGQERCCKEGCRCNTETVVEMLYRDHEGKGGFTILMGKGIDKKDIDKITGRVHIAGSCAIQDYGVMLQTRLGKKNVTMSPGCNNLALTVYGLCKQMKVNQISLAGVGIIQSVAPLIMAKLKGSRANIVPLI